MPKKFSRRHRGGGQSMPLQYLDPSKLIKSAVDAGHDLLHVPHRSSMVRPIIGGGRRSVRKSAHKRRRQAGGFVPSIMEGFVTATSKYITPIALMAMYKLIHRKKTTQKRRR